ncbi:hypothetical protein GCM10010922_02080 [Microbacterium sorbitolivorans]|uniref:Uncharacterized protein n=1 Tax=Microbacterium sorbitolivorans TaxID=1867410 RepID=A0A367Y6X6_9MICO|nr:hypothetical protein [Microbacterium sorbitolivorans]RCK61614.1 hypothetical protein DTO57_02990 [Microbacterium sorbitolivorans]GGF30670.1 hypothetical protein GCM10010922_02080 [Microbacterium sorbitolivorans]
MTTRTPAIFVIELIAHEPRLRAKLLHRANLRFREKLRGGRRPGVAQRCLGDRLRVLWRHDVRAFRQRRGVFGRQIWRGHRGAQFDRLRGDGRPRSIEVGNRRRWLADSEAHRIALRDR